MQNKLRYHENTLSYKNNKVKMKNNWQKTLFNEVHNYKNEPAIPYLRYTNR